MFSTSQQKADVKDIFQTKHLPQVMVSDGGKIPLFFYQFGEKLLSTTKVTRTWPWLHRCPAKLISSHPIVARQFCTRHFEACHLQYPQGWRSEVRY